MHSFPSRDPTKSDRLAKMGGKRHREPTTSSQLARRLKGFKGTGNRAPKRTSAGFDRLQRVVVKVHISRHRPGKIKGSLSRHVSYLGRESASADGHRGVFYDATGIDPAKEVQAWQQDRHHFRVIVSPERGEDIHSAVGLTAYIREVVKRFERDLDTKLTWIAVNHDNTDNPHAHLLIRGRKGEGTDAADLVLPRTFISQTMRRRASEVATELLGERTLEQTQQALQKEVQAERFTSLDRVIERHLERGSKTPDAVGLDVSRTRKIGFHSSTRALVLARLQFLEQMGLAQKGRGTHWQVDPSFASALKRMGARNDIIKQLYASLGPQAGEVHWMQDRAPGAEPIGGIVIVRGSTDELTESRFVVVQDAGGKSYYARLRDDDAYAQTQVGSVVRLGWQDARRHAQNGQVLAVAARNEGLYTAAAHEAYLRATEPAMAPDQIVATVRSTMGRLGFLAGLSGTWGMENTSGVQQAGDGKFRIEREAFLRSQERMRIVTDLSVLSPFRLDQQADAHALTWLDRLAFGGGTDKELLKHPAIQQALRAREAWLVQNGYAQELQSDGSPVVLRPGAMRRLAEAEQRSFREQLTKAHGKPASELPSGRDIAGTYNGTYPLHAGQQAVVVTSDHVYVTGVRQSPRVGKGADVTVRHDVDRGILTISGSGPSMQVQTLGGRQRGASLEAGGAGGAGR
jgi:type IV secretory pathway VirD2 relaxase